MIGESFFNKKKSDEKKNSKVAGAAVGTAVGLGTAGLIFNNKTNLEIKEINSSLKNQILQLVGDGKLTKSEVDSLISENGILHYNTDTENNPVSVIDKYKKNLYELISKGEKFDGDSKFMAATNKQLLGEIEEAEANAIGSLNISEKITNGFSNTVDSLAGKFSITKMAEEMNVPADIIATSGIVGLITASAIGAGFIGKKIANSIFKNKKREEAIRKFGETQVVKKEKTLKAQQASVYMGTEVPQSVQTETLNER